MQEPLITSFVKNINIIIYGEPVSSLKELTRKMKDCSILLKSLSSVFLVFVSGNGIIDCYPLLGKLQLKKILRINKESYKKLQDEARRFNIKRTNPQNAGCKKHVSKTKKYKPSRDHNAGKSIDSYLLTGKTGIPANIENIRRSPFWQWRRVRNWFNQFADADGLSTIRKNMAKNALHY